MSCIPKLRDHGLFKFILFSGNLHKQGEKKKKEKNQKLVYQLILMMHILVLLF